MKKRIYKLKNDLKYEILPKKSEKSFYDLLMYITRRKLQITLANREKLFKELSQMYPKKYKRINDFLLGLLLLAFHYLLILLIIALSHFGLL